MFTSPGLSAVHFDSISRVAGFRQVGVILYDVPNQDIRVQAAHGRAPSAIENGDNREILTFLRLPIGYEGLSLAKPV